MRKTSFAAAFLITALIAGLVPSRPAWGQWPRWGPSKQREQDEFDSRDEDDRAAPPRQRRPQPPPDVVPGKHDAYDDEEEDNPCAGTAVDMTAALGIALNRSEMGAEIGPDYKQFRERRQRQQRRFPDTPGYEMLNRVVIPAENELVEGYNGLVEKGILPLAAAGVHIDDAIDELRTLVDEGSGCMDDINTVTDALDEIVSSFSEDLSQPGSSRSADLRALAVHEQAATKLKPRLEQIKDHVCQAYALVGAAAEGPRLGLLLADKVRELASEADRRDAEALDRTTRDRTSGSRGRVNATARRIKGERRDRRRRGRLGASEECPTGNCGSQRSLESMEGRSGPVIAAAADKLAAASERTEEARNITTPITHPQPAQGKIMKAVRAIEKACEMAAGSGGGGGGTSAAGACRACGQSSQATGAELGELYQQYQQTRDPRKRAKLRAQAAACVAEARESLNQVMDSVKAAQAAADSAKSLVETAATAWEVDVQNVLGARSDQEAERELPQLPGPDGAVAAPRKSRPRAAPSPSRRDYDEDEYEGGDGSGYYEEEGGYYQE